MKSKPVTALLIGLVALMVVAAASSQADLKPVAFVSYRDSGTRGATQLYHRYGQREYILRGDMTSASLVSSSEGAQNTILTATMLSASAADGNWLFVQSWSGNQVISHLYNLDSQQEKQLMFNGIARKAAISSNRLALLVGRGPASSIVVFDCNSGAQLFSSPVVAPESAFLSFSQPNRLLIIDSAAARITPVELGTSLKVQAPYALSGPLIDDVLARANAVQQRGVKPLAQGAVLTISALSVHLTSSAGHDLFFLSGYKRSDGAPLIEVDDAASPIAAYRLQVNHEGPAAGSSTPAQNTTRVLGNRIVSLDPDGFIREYERP